MGFPGEIGTDSSGQSRIESGRSGTGLRSHTTKALKMDSEKTLAADAVATEKPTQADNARRTSRRQEIRSPAGSAGGLDADIQRRRSDRTIWLRVGRHHDDDDVIVAVVVEITSSLQSCSQSDDVWISERDGVALEILGRLVGMDCVQCAVRHDASTRRTLHMACETSRSRPFVVCKNCRMPGQ